MYIDLPEYKQQVLLTHLPQMYLTKNTIFPEPRRVLKIIKSALEYVILAHNLNLPRLYKHEFWIGLIRFGKLQKLIAQS